MNTDNYTLVTVRGGYIMSKKTLYCKACNNEISSKAKVCPNCGVKIKKPVYKKCWFWLIIVFVLIAVISVGGDDEPTTEAGDTTTVAEEVTNDIIEETEVQINTTAQKTTVAKTESKETMGQKNARKKAESYLDFSAFSREGLIEQLEFEGFSNEDAVYAVDNVYVDWNEQALKKAKSYLDFSAFSEEGLIEQLEFEGFTSSEAKYGVKNCGADWNEQAAKKAESYLDFSSLV